LFQFLPPGILIARFDPGIGEGMTPFASGVACARQSAALVAACAGEATACFVPNPAPSPSATEDTPAMRIAIRREKRVCATLNGREA
jgi:hypothetical protein